MENINNYTVYKHTSPSGKIYIGITNQNPSKRWQNGHGYSYNNHFMNAIKRYGWNNFTHEIIYDGLSKDEACKKEIELIKIYKSNKIKYGYNKSFGGEHGNAGIVRTKETIEKLRLSHIGKPSPQKGKKMSEESRKKMSEAKKGKPSPKKGTHLTDEQKLKMSKSLKGREVWNTGKTLSEEHRKKISDAHKGKKLSKGHIEKCVIKHQKKVECIEKKKIFTSIKDAEKYFGKRMHIADVCKGKRETSGGYHWKYV